MEIKTETKRMNITLRLYRAEQPGYEPDCFSDMESSFPIGREVEPGDTAILASDAETLELIAWWGCEVAVANRGEDGERLAALTPEELERGDEWSLDVQEEDQ